eukprot:TRINITY_DN17020_c0_g1_i2.p1 TRINITY_DN17020_c0_g1~~TRINITY_DN17020_c0_g1_i2.p1  ORF type:complete len:313 (+),score=29.50 TRINITY_DN17020_c0_g1_i2:361-1299(+)
MGFPGGVRGRRSVQGYAPARFVHGRDSWQVKSVRRQRTNLVAQPADALHDLRSKLHAALVDVDRTLIACEKSPANSGAHDTPVSSGSTRPRTANSDWRAANQRTSQSTTSRPSTSRVSSRPSSRVSSRASTRPATSRPSTSRVSTPAAYRAYYSNKGLAVVDRENAEQLSSPPGSAAKSASRAGTSRLSRPSTTQPDYGQNQPLNSSNNDFSDWDRPGAWVDSRAPLSQRSSQPSTARPSTCQSQFKNMQYDTNPECNPGYWESGIEEWDQGVLLSGRGEPLRPTSTRPITANSNLIIKHSQLPGHLDSAAS